MNKQEFFEAVINSEDCPADFEEKYEFFCKFQKLAMRTLLEFHRVCEKNNIHYMLADGSLLGAVRNHGQIPWDYDIDVFIPMEERSLLIEALKKDLDSGFYFLCPEVDEHCRHYIMRLAPKGYRTEELHVDVFYYLGAPDSESERKKIAFRFARLVKNRYHKLVNVKEASYGRAKIYLKLLLMKIKLSGISLKNEYKEYSGYSTEFPLKGSHYILRADGFGIDAKSNYLEYYSDDFSETILLKTDDGEFRIPKGYDRILRETYGDYGKEPPIGSCIKEIQNSLEMLKHAKKD